MTNELSTERAIEALYTVRAYYASLTAGYPKGKDCRGIGDVMCSEIANSCLMAIKALEQHPCEDCISREAVFKIFDEACYIDDDWYVMRKKIEKLPSVTLTRPKARWIILDECANEGVYCSKCHKTVFKLEFSHTMKWRNFKYCPNCGADMRGESE